MNGFLVLQEDGRFSHFGKETADIGVSKAQQIRVGRGAFAVQKLDGNWVIWGDGNAEKLNKAVSQLGPLADFALGERFFIGIK